MQQQEKPRLIAEAMRNQFFSSFKMLKTLVDVCPEEIWAGYFNEVPFWYQVYHVVYFVDFWLRESYIGTEFRCMAFDERIPPEFEHDIGPDLHISLADMKAYLQKLEEKLGRFFEWLYDDRMAQPVIEGESQFTYTDVIACQIRHIMYNIGYCNGILRQKGLEESDWYAYNEKEDSQ